MKVLEGKTVFVTGGASGIGFGMAQALGRRAMKVMIADIEADRLKRAVEDLQLAGVDADGLVVDVADRLAMVDAAARTVARFGKVHVVCNNAGVIANGPIGQVTEGDWDWIIDVNLMGVVYGTEAFLPHIKAHGEGGHFVNTASVAGHVSTPFGEPYCGTKYAVVGMSAAWAADLAPVGIGVSVLCPGFVQSRINDSKRTRRERYGETAKADDNLEVNRIIDELSMGTPAELVGERVIEAILGNEHTIMTHPHFDQLISRRYKAILAAFDRAAASSIIPKELAPTFGDVFDGTTTATPTDA